MFIELQGVFYNFDKVQEFCFADSNFFNRDSGEKVDGKRIYIRFENGTKHELFYNSEQMVEYTRDASKLTNMQLGKC